MANEVRWETLQIGVVFYRHYFACGPNLLLVVLGFVVWFEDMFWNVEEGKCI